MSPRRHRLVATCSRGLEPLLVEELAELGIEAPEPGRGAVSWRGALETGYRALLESRLASRILLEIGFGRATSERVLYETVRALPWTHHLGPEQTVAVDFVGINPGIRHTGFGAQRVKDALCDHLREATGARPDVDREAPALRLQAYLREKHLALHVDLAGAPMHLRSAGVEGGAAPLKETLAAAILRLAGWHRAQVPLVDPMCGSGTLLREAASMACGDAPGRLREMPGSPGWRGHDRALWARMLAEVRTRPRRPTPPILGRDVDPHALALARRGLLGLDLADRVVLEVGALADARPPTGPPGLVLTNPPYGERLGTEEQARATLVELGRLLRARFPGWRAFVLAGNPDLARAVGLRPARRIPLYNGALECRLLDLPIDERAPA